MFNTTENFFANYVMAVSVTAQSLQSLADLYPEYTNEQVLEKDLAGLRDRRPSLLARFKQYMRGGSGHR